MARFTPLTPQLGDTRIIRGLTEVWTGTEWRPAKIGPIYRWDISPGNFPRTWFLLLGRAHYHNMDCVGILNGHYHHDL